jgi:hypothetical protein
MGKYASGRHAQAICDQCGWSFPYGDLRQNSYGMMVCPTDWDGGFDLANHPQLNPAPPARDAEALRNPRPDSVLVSSGDADWEPNDSRWQQQSSS